MHREDSEILDLVVIGSGSAALWLGREAVKNNISCAIIDAYPFAAHASTRNQGWLQSGAFYRTVNDKKAAKACWEGFKEIRAFAPEAVDTDVPAYFLFEFESERQESAQGCRDLGLEVSEVNITTIEERTPIVRGIKKFPYVLAVPDRPFDSTVVFRKLLAELTSSVRFIEIESIFGLEIDRSEDGWVVRSPGQVLRCQVLVLACGPLIPTVLRDLFSLDTQANRFVPTKIPVLAIQRPVVNALLATPRRDGNPEVPGGPNIVPFDDGDVTGITVCLQGYDMPCRDGFDEEFAPGYLGVHEDRLYQHYPSLATTIANVNAVVSAHFYVCHKLKMLGGSVGSRKSRSHIVEECGHNLFAFYAGKSTSAPVAARDCVQSVLRHIGTPSGALAIEPRPDSPPVRQRRYRDHGDFYVEASTRPRGIRLRRRSHPQE